jgi:Mn2+/Fe2+ NRAMP family transporter
MCARLGAYTGEGLGALIREQFSIRVTAFALVALIVANVGLVVSEFAGIAAAMELLHVSKLHQHPGRGGRDLGAGGLRVLQVRRAAVPGAEPGVLRLPGRRVPEPPRLRPGRSQLAYPHFLATKAFLLLVVALIGTTITPYMQFYVAAAVADRGIGPADYPARGSTPSPGRSSAT